jgi:hypothetical protein
MTRSNSTNSDTSIDETMDDDCDLQHQNHSTPDEFGWSRFDDGTQYKH